jgi:hypothetical protein
MKIKLYLYGALILGGALLAVAVSVYLSRQNSIEQRFAEEIQDVRSNAGDVLEVATFHTAFSLSDSDKLEISVLGLPINLGTTEAYITVPVTYRFHILLSDEWKITEKNDHIAITAPRLRASQPPAPDLSGAQYLTTNGWARFNKEEVKKRLESLITPSLRRKAALYCSSNLVKDRAKESVEAFLRQRFSFLGTKDQKKRLIIQFSDTAELVTGKRSG